MNVAAKRAALGPRTGIAATIARKGPAAKAVVNAISSAGEWKFVDTSLALSNVSTTPTVTLLNGLISGSTATTRVGRKVAFRTFELKGYTQANAAALANVVRYAIVLDKQPNGALPAFTDIYDTVTPIALRNISNKERFQVLWDSKLVNIVGGFVTGDFTECTQHVHEHFLKHLVNTQYNAGVVGDITDITTNSLLFVAIGDQATGTTAASFTGRLRLRFTDN